jgi:hypothetical protein
VAVDPSDAELLAFVDAMLSNLDRQARESAVLKQAIDDNRALWVELYRVSMEAANFDHRTP